MADSAATTRSARADLVVGYSITLAWILVSAGVVMLNKYVLELFPFPLALTAAHQAVCAAAAAAWAPPAGAAWRRQVLPIGLLFALSLGAGNAAYILLEVHFIQMLKALSPLIVYGIGVAAGVEPPKRATLAASAVVAAGVAVASAHEARFDGRGVALQLGSILCESVRLVLVQRLLLSPSSSGGGGGGNKISPLQMMALVSPACLLFLVPAAAALEGRRLVLALAARAFPPPILLLASALSALVLNVTIFALVGRAGALALNVAGVAKDALLVAASAAVFGAAVRRAQMAGYGLALCGAVYYNWRRAVDARERAGREAASEQVVAAAAEKAVAAPEEDERRLSTRSSGGGGDGAPLAGRRKGGGSDAGEQGPAAARPSVRAVAVERAALLRGRSSGGGGRSGSGGGEDDGAR